MEPSEAQSSPVEPSGAKWRQDWQLLALFGNFWQLVTTCGNFWHFLATFGNFLATFWQLFGNFFAIFLQFFLKIFLNWFGIRTKGIHFQVTSRRGCWMIDSWPLVLFFFWKCEKNLQKICKKIEKNLQKSCKIFSKCAKKNFSSM